MELLIGRKGGRKRIISQRRVEEDKINQVQIWRKRRDCNLGKQMLKKQRGTEIDTVVVMSGMTPA